MYLHDTQAALPLWLLPTHPHPHLNCEGMCPEIPQQPHTQNIYLSAVTHAQQVIRGQKCVFLAVQLVVQ